MFSGFLVCDIHGDLIPTDDLQDVLHHCVLIDKLDDPSFGSLGFYLFLVFCTSSMLLRQGLVKGVFLTKASSHGLAISRKVFKYPCAYPTKEISIHRLPIAWPDITDIDPWRSCRISHEQLAQLLPREVPNHLSIMVLAHR